MRHNYRLHWLLCDVPCEVEEPFQLILGTPSGDFQVQVMSSALPMESSLERAAPNGARGWRSAYYMHRQPALSAEYVVNAKAATFWTVFGPKGYEFDVSGPDLSIQSPHWIAQWSMNQGGFPLNRVAVSGQIEDSLEL